MPRAKRTDQTRQKPIVLGAPEHRVRVVVTDEVRRHQMLQIIVHAAPDEVTTAVTEALSSKFGGKKAVL